MVKSLKAKIFLVEMNWKYVINVCQGVIDKRSINGSFNNIDFCFRQGRYSKEKSLMYVFDFEGRIKNTSILVIVCGLSIYSSGCFVLALCAAGFALWNKKK